VPVTAKLSRKFYDALGDDIANELVEWFNQVDLTYRTELRGLNEVNFARFDAKLEQRVMESEARLQQRITALDAKLEQRVTTLGAKIDQRVTELRAGLERGFAQVDAKLDRLRAELIKWMFLFWIGSVGLALLIGQLR
jgi:ABC-type phosphate transport system auxiliary subunit